MIRFLLLGIISLANAQAIEPPTLFAADALNDSTIRVQWRNNSMTVDGFQILRKMEGLTAFTIIDTVDPGTAIYSDTGLSPLTKYYYGIIAFFGTDQSDTSNIDSAVTPERYIPPPPKIPSPKVVAFWDTAAKHISLTIKDYSECKLGYSIFKKIGDEQDYLPVKQINSLNPTDTGDIVWTDTIVTTNCYYSYEVFVLGCSETLSVNTYIYTLYEPTFFGPLPDKEIVLTDSLSTFPLSNWVWAIKKGDSIILSENPAPDSTASIINVSNKNHPFFAGYIPDASYNYEQYVVLSDRIIGGGYTSLNDSIPKPVTLFRFQDNAIKRVYQGPINVRLSNNMMLNDSTFLAEVWDCDDSPPPCSGEGYYHFWRPLVVDSVSLRFTSSISDAGLNFYMAKRYTAVHNQRLASCYYLYDAGTYFSGFLLVDFSYTQPFTVFKSTSYTYPYPLYHIPNYSNNIYGYGIHDNRFSQTQRYIIDTTVNMAYLLYNNRLTIFSYTIVPVKTQSNNRTNKLQQQDISAYPNPFNPQVILTYYSSSANPHIAIYDIHGRLIEQFKGLRDNRIIWNAQGHPSGVYLVRLTDGSKQITRKIVLQK